jgi:hypothetical protein
MLTLREEDGKAWTARRYLRSNPCRWSSATNELAARRFNEFLVRQARENIGGSHRAFREEEGLSSAALVALHSVKMFSHGL